MSGWREWGLGCEVGDAGLVIISEWTDSVKWPRVEQGFGRFVLSAELIENIDIEAAP